MAAEVHIHALVGITEEDLRVFFSSHLGSKWFVEAYAPDDPLYPERVWERTAQKIKFTPCVRVGDVSWLKAGISGNFEEFIPGAIQIISDLIGETLPVLDEGLEKKILEALTVPNTSRYQVDSGEDIAIFLEMYRGFRLFIVSW